MATSFVQTRLDGSIYYVTLNRSEKRNALSVEFLRELADAIAAADAHPEVRAIVVDAEGPIFSAGVDILDLAGQKANAADLHPSRWLRRLAADLQHSLNRIEQTELPIIGLLHGKVLGLGLELALSFDFRVADSDCSLGLPETRLGLIADVGGTTRLTKLVGPSRTKDLLMTARELSAEEAYQWGLINRLASQGQARATAIALAEDIARNAPLAVGLAKLVVDHGLGVDSTTQMFIERLAQSQLVSSEDTGEAMAAFIEKRPANWKGR